MSEEVQAATEGEGQEPTEETTAPAAVEKQVAENVTALPDWAQSLIVELRKENASHRRAKKDAEKAATQAQEARLADQAEWQVLAEQRQARIAELESAAEQYATQLRERTIRAAFETHAAKLGAQHPGDAYALADLTSVSVGDDGKAVGVEEQVKVLVESGRLPTSTRAPSLDGGAGGGSPRDTTLPEVTDAQVQEFAAIYGLVPENVDRKMLAQYLAQQLQ